MAKTPRVVEVSTLHHTEVFASHHSARPTVPMAVTPDAPIASSAPIGADEYRDLYR